MVCAKAELEVGYVFIYCSYMREALEQYFSRILPSTGRRLMGRYDEGCSGGLPGLRIVTIIDDFQVVGK